MWLQLFAAIVSFQLYYTLYQYGYVTLNSGFQSDDRTCSPPFSCGEVKEITYPFKLQGSECPGYPLICQDNTTLLFNLSQYYYPINGDPFSSRKYQKPRFQGIYHVKKISISSDVLLNLNVDDNWIQIADPNFASYSSSSSVCLSPRYSIVGSMLPYLGDFSAMVMWVKCRKRRGDGQLDPATYLPLPCLDSNNSSSPAWHHYLLSNSDMTVEQLDRSCQIEAKMPIIYGEGRDGSLILNIGRISSHLQMGFQMRTDRQLCDFCDQNIDGCFLTDCLPGRTTIDWGKMAQKQFIWIVKGGILVFGIVPRSLGLLFLTGLLIYKLKNIKRSPSDNVEKVLRQYQNLMPRRYSYPEIKIITGHFREKLGQGGFGSVFKGNLFDGRPVAVKLLGKAKSRGQDFINEVATIGRIHHVNIVRLLGFCSEGSKRALIYEFMPNGSLDKYVFPGNNSRNHTLLSWEMLYKIALGIARGIEYLHRGCDVCILHFDIKPHNVLLDDNFCPKISDFGLAKVSPTQATMTLSGYRGTIGYIAPEQVSRNFGGVSYKSDVYSFGMLLLQMAERVRNWDMLASCSNQIYFPAWIYEQLSNGQYVGFGKATKTEGEIVKKLALVGLCCVKMTPANRPSMSQVIEMLEGSSVALQLPPKSSFMFSNEMYDEESSLLRCDVEEVTSVASSSYGGTVI